MRAIVITESGGPEVLRFRTDQPAPLVSETEIAVDVASIGVNFIDIAHRDGIFPVPLPFVPGVEAAGTVAAVGTAVDTVAVGDRVAWAMPRDIAQAGGGYAERTVIPADRAIPVPGDLDIDTAAAGLMHGLTAHYLTSSVYPVRPGDTVLVHAAAGGLGLMLTQVVKLLGGKVIGTTSTSDKAKFARRAGADEVIGYHEVPARVHELTGGVGVAAVYDGIGGPTFDDSLASLRRRGTLALVGGAGGPVPPLDLTRLLTGGSLRVTRPGIGDFIADPAELSTRATEVFDWLRHGKLTIHIGGNYSLADAAQAHRDLHARHTTGKLVLRP
ncbi:MAG: quinone oxidoreductase family protein [Stackebrandtia sp.]